MECRDKSDVLHAAKEAGVKFVKLQFTDIFGIMKNVAITVEQLEKALDNEIMFDGSSVEGFVRIEESDMYLHPDPTTFLLLPWSLDGEGKEARLICDVYTADREPFEGDPRYRLRKAIKKAKEMGGYKMYLGPEAEFFLFKNDHEGKHSLVTNDQAGYFDLATVDLGDQARRDMCLTLQKMGFEIEASHHECAPGQHEIDFKYAEALKSADDIMTFKMVVKWVAQNKNLYATFMPKPIFGEAGSGMHMNQSLFVDGENIFYDPKDGLGLSQTAYHYIAGLLKHARAMTAITNPLVNSYKRLVPGFEAPIYIAWSARNRSPLVRIPSKRGVGTRIELRNPDPSCNPYLAVAVALSAGLDGIANKLEPPKPLNCNIYNMTEEERCQNCVETLPLNLNEAIEEMLADNVIKEALGEHITARYTEAKRIEWGRYASWISDWEIDNYLGKY